MVDHRNALTRLPAPERREAGSRAERPCVFDCGKGMDAHIEWKEGLVEADIDALLNPDFVSPVVAVEREGSGSSATPNVPEPFRSDFIV